MRSTYIGGRAEYSCNSGYKLSGSNSSQICQTSGNWTGMPPTCIREFNCFWHSELTDSYPCWFIQENVIPYTFLMVMSLWPVMMLEAKLPTPAIVDWDWWDYLLVPASQMEIGLEYHQLVCLSECIHAPQRVTLLLTHINHSWVSSTQFWDWLCM